MKVRDIMTTDVVTATPDTTLDQIAGIMRDQDVGAIPILDDHQLVGIVTDRDIIVRCIAEGKDPSGTSAEEVLIEEELETILPDVDAEEAAQLMASRQIRRLPVVEDEVLVGIISLGDISAKGDSEAAGEALEDVSQGVRKGAGSSGRAGAQSSSASRLRELAPDEYSELELEEDEMQEEELRGESRSAPRMNRGQSAQAASRGGRSSEDSRRHTSSGGKRPPQSSGRQGGGQGISIRGKKQEQPRQQKVAPARAQGKNASKRRAG